jgi:GT2 family glycosyltransferase
METVSIIILGYNGKQFLSDCLSSVLDQTYPLESYEVIYADNGSKDGSADWVSEHFPSVKVLRFKRNWGFCVGNNRAADLAKGRYIVFLNQDMIVHRRWLAELVGALAGSTLVKAAHSTGQAFQPDRIERVAMLDRVYYSEVARYGTIEHTEIPLQSQPIPTLHLGGGAMILDRQVVEELDYIFDPRLFAYGEDLDLGLRLNGMGYQVVCVPTAIAYHCMEGRDQLSRKTLWRASMATKNRFLVYMKNMYVDEYILALPLLFYGTISKMRNTVRHPVKRLIYSIALIPFTAFHLLRAIIEAPKFLPDRRRTLARRSHHHGRRWLLDVVRTRGAGVSKNG